MPPGSKLNAEQAEAYRARSQYGSVHTDASKCGKIRTKLAR